MCFKIILLIKSFKANLALVRFISTVNSVMYRQFGRTVKRSPTNVTGVLFSLVLQLSLMAFHGTICK